MSLSDENDAYFPPTEEDSEYGPSDIEQLEAIDRAIGNSTLRKSPRAKATASKPSSANAATSTTAIPRPTNAIASSSARTIATNALTSSSATPSATNALTSSSATPSATKAITASPTAATSEATRLAKKYRRPETLVHPWQCSVDSWDRLIRAAATSVAAKCHIQAVATCGWLMETLKGQLSPNPCRPCRAVPRTCYVPKSSSFRSVSCCAYCHWDAYASSLNQAVLSPIKGINKHFDASSSAKGSSMSITTPRLATPSHDLESVPKVSSLRAALIKIESIQGGDSSSKVVNHRDGRKESEEDGLCEISKQDFDRATPKKPVETKRSVKRKHSAIAPTGTSSVKSVNSAQYSMPRFDEDPRKSSSRSVKKPRLSPSKIKSIKKVKKDKNTDADQQQRQHPSTSTRTAKSAPQKANTIQPQPTSHFNSDSTYSLAPTPEGRKKAQPSTNDDIRKLTHDLQIVTTDLTTSRQQNATLVSDKREILADVEQAMKWYAESYRVLAQKIDVYREDTIARAGAFETLRVDVQTVERDMLAFHARIIKACTRNNGP